MHHLWKSVSSALALAGALAMGTGAAQAATTSTMTTGTLHVWVTGTNSAVEPILFTGVIGDHGTSTSIDKDGKVDENGSYEKIKLQQGTFEVNAVAIAKNAEKTGPSVDTATCSLWQTLSGDVTLFDGTGKYARITGTINTTGSYALILPRYATGPKAGQCNESNNAQPVAQFNGDVTGSGKVSF